MATGTPDKAITEYPFYWFALLEQAAGDGDFQQAAEAQRQLARLGVTVIYTPGRLRQQPHPTATITEAAGVREVVANG